MPVILAKEAWNAWLDPALSIKEARALLTIPPVDDWQAEPVSTWVNIADHDDPKCIAPAEVDDKPRPAQGTLWD